MEDPTIAEQIEDMMKGGRIEILNEENKPVYQHQMKKFVDEEE